MHPARPCPYCGETAWTFFCEGTDRVHHLTNERFLYDRCGRCRAVVMRTLPSAEQIASFYPETYSAYQSAPGNTHDWSALTALPVTGSALEIGCGAGHVLASFSRFRPQWTVTGVDFSRQAVEVAQIAVPHGAFVHADLPSWLANAPEQKYDLVISEHVMEHVTDPLGLFRHALRLLAPGGTLVFAIPNAESWTMGMFRDAAFHLEAPRHLCIPSNQTIQLLCAREGARIVHHRGQAYPTTFMRSLAFVAPKLASLLYRVRFPSVIRELRKPIQDALTKPFSKITYVIQKHP